VEVSHRYRFSAGAGIGFEEVAYITRTGAFWNGPIDSAEFVLSPRTAAFGLSWPADFGFAGFEERIGTGGGEGRVAYRFETRDWTPRQDFVVSLHGWPIPSTLAGEKGLALPCPDPAALMDGDASSEPAADGPLSGSSDADLGLCRNLPYARHGYPFQRAELQETLYREVPVPDGGGASPRRFRLAAPNRFFNDALLDDTDRAYIAAIRAEQGRRTGAAGVREALQAEILRTLGIESVLQVAHLNIRGDWAWAHVLPRSSDGQQHYEDISALLRKTDGRWRVEEIACTEADDPACLGNRGFTSGLKSRFPELPLDLLDE
jgi:YARHG domain